jgi:hypothetical protein
MQQSEITTCNTRNCGNGLIFEISNFYLFEGMGINSQLLITQFLTLGLLTACSEMNPHPMDMSQAVQSAASKADQEGLAD